MAIFLRLKIEKNLKTDFFLVVDSTFLIFRRGKSIPRLFPFNETLASPSFFYLHKNNKGLEAPF
ncbi:hypothetical protein [Bacillus sp. THAF10]|uniref:hypothetical protein n=1 Tax=Bacillus sp. THAF10 TaxID=2587848 RepID=UPI001267BD4A|nr:hypothetical protein [Bacillus sp. THAF10]